MLISGNHIGSNPMNMGHIPTTREQKITWLICLFFKCPVTQNNPCDCQLYNMRQHYTVQQYTEYINSLTDEKINELFMKHIFCEKNHI